MFGMFLITSYLIMCYNIFIRVFRIIIFSSCKVKDTEFMQYLKPLGSGPSGKTCPGVHHTYYTLLQPSLYQRGVFSYLMAFSFIGCVKLGHPVPELNLIVESNKGVSQQTQQLYFPAS